MPSVLDDQQPGGRELEAWEMSAPGAYVTIRAGGPLDGVVTLTVASGGVVVEATWGSRYARTTLSAERPDHASASELADVWADGLAGGREPRAD